MKIKNLSESDTQAESIAPVIRNSGGNALSRTGIEILKSQNNIRPNRLCANEDAGEMSEWAVCSSMGLYASAGNGMENHLFSGSLLILANKKTFNITAEKISGQTRMYKLLF